MPKAVVKGKTVHFPYTAAGKAAAAKAKGKGATVSKVAGSKAVVTKPMRGKK